MFILLNRVLLLYETTIKQKNKMLDSIITSKTRLRLLVKFFINTSNEAHLRGLATEFNESTNAIRKELNNLSDAGYLEKENVQNKVRYKANIHHPLFGSLQDIVRKYLGLDTLVANVVERMGEVQQVVVTGDYANGLDSGTICVTIVGQSLDSQYVAQLSEKIEVLIDRKVALTLTAMPQTTGLILWDSMGEVK